MRTIHTLWKGLINIALILLPVFILAVFTMQFGQPLVEIYQDYFQGNPVRELEETTQDLVDNHGQDIPFRRLNRQYDGAQSVKDIGDTDASRLRTSIIRVHRSVVNRLGTGKLRAMHGSYSDSYTHLLRNSLIGKIFSRPDLVRNRLKEDLGRIGSLPGLPSHPARGLNRFWNSSDTASRLIKSYGEIYANKLTCSQVFDATCERVYGPSTRLTGQFLAQYLENWPKFSRTLPPDLDVLNRRLSPLHTQYTDFTDQVEGYLRTQPWSNLTELNQAFQDYQKKYRDELGRWYRSVIGKISLDVQEFSARQWSPNYQKLNLLRSLENELKNNANLNDFLMTDKNADVRENLINQLTQTYVKVSARQNFDEGFQAATSGIEALRETLNELTVDGTIMMNLKSRLNDASDLHRKMSRAMSDRDYRTMVTSLQSLSETIENTRREPWITLGREFLSGNRDKIADPDWQPTSGEASGNYRRVVTLFGRLGKELELSELNQQWVDRTLLALKSRRFNQLKHELKRSLSQIDKDADLNDVREILREIRGLEELPDELSSQVPVILSQSAMLEKIQVGTSKIKGAFADLIDANSKLSSRWKKLQSLLEELNSPDDQLLPIDGNLQNYVSQWKNWIDSIDRSTSLGDLVQERAVSKLQKRLQVSLAGLKDQLNFTGEDGPSGDVLLPKMESLSKALQIAKLIEGFDETYNIGLWQNVLLVRQDLTRLRDRVDDLSKGSLWGENQTFESYENTVSQVEWRPLPSDYDASIEQAKLRQIFRVVRDRTRSIDEESTGDWLPGWGGRVTGKQIIDPWIQFLQDLRKNSRHPEISSTVKELMQSSKIIRQEVSGEND